MTEKRMSIREFIKREAAGDFTSKDVDTQIEAGWYDWFCRDSSLASKTKILASKLRQVLGTFTDKIDLDNHYVWFKNNCPVYGKLYDDFRIASIKDGKSIFCIVPKGGYDSKPGVAELWGAENEFEKPIVEGIWEDIIKWFSK